MYIPNDTAFSTRPVVPGLSKRLSSFPGSNHGSLSKPLNIFIPVFAVFFSLVIIAVLAPKIRQCYVHDQLRSAERRSNHSRTQFLPNRTQPFEIDGPTVTPFPAPSETPTIQYPWTPRETATSPRASSPTRPGHYPWTPRMPEQAHVSSSTRQVSSTPVVQVIPPAYSFISSPQAEAERDVPATTTSGQMGGLERPASEIPRVQSPVGLNSGGSISGVDAPPQYESVVSPVR
ncbi:hypothetical protein IAT40_003424 [Kwoniella sp. CBS 6097]